MQRVREGARNAKVGDDTDLDKADCLHPSAGSVSLSVLPLNPLSKPPLSSTSPISCRVPSLQTLATPTLNIRLYDMSSTQSDEPLDASPGPADPPAPPPPPTPASPPSALPRPTASSPNSQLKFVPPDAGEAPISEPLPPEIANADISVAREYLTLFAIIHLLQLSHYFSGWIFRRNVLRRCCKRAQASLRPYVWRRHR